MKIRLSVYFDCTVEVPDESTWEVSLAEAKNGIELALPHYLDGAEMKDCEIQGVNNITIETM